MVNTLFFAPAGFTDLLGLFGVLSAVMLAASVILAILKGNAAKKGDAAKEAKRGKITKYCLIACGLCAALTVISFTASMSEYTGTGRF